ncbi:RidA family protein [Chryseobacterium sp. Bi04]|uniref:RidA family protein n=1 Tax=Chryseobacterium sp. Bi04 TaxID=2822345 RepID=UPI001DF5A84F|nr:RidA family protein [Chryseobacterium sp. Bi04]CAH0193879.1 hypothetical protein SRABI04_01807 [Chryseobacterium sp. Bi04]
MDFVLLSKKSLFVLVTGSLLISCNGTGDDKMTKKKREYEKKQLNIVNPDKLFDPLPYSFSHSISVDAPLKFCFIAGQSGGIGEQQILSNNFRIQVKNALQNLKVALNSQSMTMDNVVKANLLIVNYDQEKLKIWEEEAKKVWRNSQFPTSTLIPVSQLALPNMLFEIDAIAVQGK